MMSERQSADRVRFISVIAATVIALACGTNYVYSAWAPQFAQRLKLSATQTNLIGTMGNLGMYATGIPGGIVIDSRGPRWGVAIGTVLFAGGYYPIGHAFDAGPGVYSMASLCFFSFLTGAGSCSAFSAAIKAAALNFPDHRGTATAFPLAAFGLSAFFFATVALALPHDTSHFLLLLACGTVFLPATSFFLLNTPSEHKPQRAPHHDTQRLRHTNLPNDSDTVHARRVTRPITPKNASKSSTQYDEDDDTRDEQASLLSGSSSSGPGTPASDMQHSKQSIRSQTSDAATHHDIRGLALLRHTEFYQLFLMLALMCGIGLMTINNIGNVAQALWKHFDPSSTDAFIAQRQVLHVSILSVCSFSGRLLSGIGSDILVRKFNASRFWCLFVAACVFTCAQCAALLISNPRFLVFVSGLTGIAYGMLFGVYPSLVAQTFGVAGMSTNWGCMILAPVISGNIFNLIYGKIYDDHSVVDDDDGGRECLQGKSCYAASYWMTLVASLCAIILCLWTIRHEFVVARRKEKEKRRESFGGSL